MLGHHSSDTSELWFADSRIPAGNLLGEEGRAMEYMIRELPQERLIIAVASIAAGQMAFDITVEYVKARTAFGKTIASMQHTRFSLADLKAGLSVGWAYAD